MYRFNSSCIALLSLSYFHTWKLYCLCFYVWHIKVVSVGVMLTRPCNRKSLQCCTFFILFIVDVCLSTVAKCVNIIWFFCQHFITTTEGIVNVFSLNTWHKPMTSLQVHRLKVCNCKPRKYIIIPKKYNVTLFMTVVMLIICCSVYANKQNNPLQLLSLILTNILILIYTINLNIN